MRLAILANLKHSGQRYLAGVQAELELVEHELAALVKAGVVAVLGAPAAPADSDNDPGDEQPPVPNASTTTGESGTSPAGAPAGEAAVDAPAANDQANASPSTGEASAEPQAEVAAKPKAKAAK